MRKIYKLSMLLTAIIAILTACSDEPLTDNGGLQTGELTLTESEVVLPVKGRYYTIGVNTENNSLQKIMVTTDSEWIELDTDNVEPNGEITFYADDNNQTTSRTAAINFTTPDGITTECTIIQRGTGDDEDNSTDYKYCYVGYGYNIFNDYMNTRSICESIIDIDKVTALYEGKPFVQKSLKSSEKMEYITANSLFEMSELLTTKQTSTSYGWKGATKTVSRFEISKETIQTENRYCYLSLKYIVGAAVMDYSVLQQMMDSGMDVFSGSFKTMYEQVISDPGKDNIDKLLNKFGTHLITSTEIGGMIDLAVNFSYEMKGEINMRAEDYSDYFFKHEPSEYIKPGTNFVDGITSEVKNKGTFNIIGGSKEAQERIINDITPSEQNKMQAQINPENMLEWVSSLNLNSFDDLETIKNGNIAPVNFQFVPIWSLFPNNLRGIFMERVTKLSEKNTDKSFNEIQLGTDVYKFKLKNQAFMNFKDDKEQSLVRVVYASNKNNDNMTPLLEICNEYVPVIRGDKRINVIYPIRNGKTFHGCGLFPGDGEGNPPAWLTFSDGKVYVRQISMTNGANVIDSVYSIHGNIYTTDLGINIQEPLYIKAVDQILTLKGKTYKESSFPIVKISNGYWTRRNLDIEMAFGYPLDPNNPQSKYSVKESIRDGMLFANFFCGNQYTVTNNNKNIYGYTDDGSKWYLPKTKAKNELEYYFGYNLKPLFNGQASGFDAQFAGYFGRHDDLNNGEEIHDIMMPMYKDRYCFLPFKDDEKTGVTLMLTPTYKFYTIKAEVSHDNRYPIRLYRTANYKYE